MKIFGWNARGLGSPRAFNTLLTHKQETNVEIMFLMETRCDQNKMELWRVKLGYTGKIVVSTVRKSGGLYLFWDKRVDLFLLSFSMGHIDVRIQGANNGKWRFTGFYGNPDKAQRANSWSLLRRLAGLSRLPWVCLGDFNEILSDDEKRGGRQKNWRDILAFREAIFYCNLEDLGFVGDKYTWCNKRNGDELMMERLDRSFGNKEWEHLFPSYNVRHLDYWNSYHRLVVLNFSKNLS
ncbi:hypothetical protein Ddye_003677 [Dipteronia dyeriana]|uniref:Endonuclease/exonuclease/phosphatase domain-containing protein n=1 Tax=Dipteronia dyeriana TaxID=168575 RepID=A0AAD9XTF5_9ROSI|nr:hypothetical protein Ddye_003677 [Dipteronia dyeriana]